jgi:hypothetical protein
MRPIRLLDFKQQFYNSCLFYGGVSALFVGYQAGIFNQVGHFSPPCINSKCGSKWKRMILWTPFFIQQATNAKG